MITLVCLDLFADYSLNQEKYPSLTKLVSSQDVPIKVNLECLYLEDFASLPPFLRYVDKFKFSLVLSVARCPKAQQQ